MAQKINIGGIRKRLSDRFTGGFNPYHIPVRRLVERAFHWGPAPFDHDVFQPGSMISYRALLAASRREAKTPRRS